MSSAFTHNSNSTITVVGFAEFGIRLLNFGNLVDSETEAVPVFLLSNEVSTLKMRKLLYLKYGPQTFTIINHHVALPSLLKSKKYLLLPLSRVIIVM